MDRKRVARFAPWAVPMVVLVVAATLTFGRGVHDERDILAGWFYPTMSAVGSVLVGVIVTVIAVIAMWVTGRRGRGPIGRVVRRSVATAVGGLWLGYVAGVGVTSANGGPVDYPGVVRYELGSPIGRLVEVPGTCTSVVGHQTLLAEVKPEIDGLPTIVARSKSAGTPSVGAFPKNNGRPNDDYELANVPDRPLDALLPDITFIRAYHYVPASHADLGFADRLPLVGRWSWPGHRLANDPWPESFELTVSWVCPTGP
jgi:hypothetical protein